MAIIADLHIHGRFSRGTSTSLDIDNLQKYALIKGVDLLGTGDFTHPKWIEELKQKLAEDDTGILRTKDGFPFVLQTELSLIYTHQGKGRKVHLVVLAKNFDIVRQITEYLKKKGRVDYDGRPIFGMPCPEFVEDMMKIAGGIEVIPAHIWTPWFSMFGSNSGFDSVKDCFQDQTRNIHALETGMSSDPEMNWRLSQLDDFALVSSSDLHSFWPWRIGREATLFDIRLTYDNLIKAIRTREGLQGTIEVDPGYGKYHYTGHRNCNICLDPKQARKLGDICPNCGKKLTVGVLERVEALADRPMGFRPKGAKPFRRLIPLSEILAKLLDREIATQAVWKEYNNLIANFKSEFNILLNASENELMKFTSPKIAEMIIRNREGKIEVKPGFDGEYGIPVFSDEDRKIAENPQKIRQKQTSLGEF
ncbi:DNA helicase UvrD [Candidatus Woesearchaeota archaeon CG10_big_fil_rev_8_21_14_0_10_44_13]|nr:MAG: DNA helicase UvrD [Candidatus Woesearchaeota archaeon CG10_big_fil_rev_8_21_14_0_10_44_13]